MMFVASGKLSDTNNNHIILPCAVSKDVLQVSTINSLQCFHGIIDTGASITSISSKIVQQFELEALPIKAYTNTAAGKIEVTQHIINIVLFNENKSMWWAKASQVVQCIPFEGDILIGMDILKHSTFIITPDGHYNINL